jgi:hypothetical protein
MTDKRTQAHADESNMQKDPDQWTTGDEPMTGAQRSYLKTLSEEAKVPFDEGLTKAQASKRIDELQEMTGRGKSQSSAARGDRPQAEPSEQTESDRGAHGLAGRSASGNPGTLGAAPGAAGGVMPGATGGTPGAGGGKPGTTPGGTPAT